MILHANPGDGLLPFWYKEKTSGAALGDRSQASTEALQMLRLPLRPDELEAITMLSDGSPFISSVFLCPIVCPGIGRSNIGSEICRCPAH